MVYEVDRQSGFSMMTIFEIICLYLYLYLYLCLCLSLC